MPQPHATNNPIQHPQAPEPQPGSCPSGYQALQAQQGAGPSGFLAPRAVTMVNFRHLEINLR